ncbi:MAG: prepilin-type N-terminal cleavage/methylation domain-containing protein [Dechloromonas sp.]|uniref:Prepilin-type N-terminal cleavage/methylation domain-containing protein n=1 Tax=Candidatus Dechloromonas phosphorivorans TaxID=2899244 RepID=A0A935N1Q8_9RHOO|nr:prepilin-type N-terminal cleavage/methylation domain-containing protein [Candidatus Dechloromonas phosphorivorans]
MKQLSSGLRQHGLSLVELMVALAIGTLIALAISTLFFQVFSGSRTADDTARASEAGSFGLRTSQRGFSHGRFCWPN